MQYNRISIYDEGVFTTMASHKYLRTVSTVSVAAARALLTAFVVTNSIEPKIPQSRFAFNLILVTWPQHNIVEREIEDRREREKQQTKNIWFIEFECDCLCEVA